MEIWSGARSLVDRTYTAILNAICDGRLPPGAHLVQEALAESLGVSRQPIQQALLLLRNDGVIEETKRRGMVVAPLDPVASGQRYEVLGMLNALAGRRAAERCAASAELAASFRDEGGRILAEGEAALGTGPISTIVGYEIAFHTLIYRTSGNAAIEPAARPLWRNLQRVRGELMRRLGHRPDAWRSHRELLDAIARGDAELAGQLATREAETAIEQVASCIPASAARGASASS